MHGLVSSSAGEIAATVDETVDETVKRDDMLRRKLIMVQARGEFCVRRRKKGVALFVFWAEQATCSESKAVARARDRKRRATRKILSRPGQNMPGTKETAFPFSLAKLITTLTCVAAVDIVSGHTRAHLATI